MMEVDEREPLINGKKEDGEADKYQIRIKPRRTLIVEPLLVLYALAGLPLMTIKAQYMYQKIARDMGIDLGNLSTNGSACDQNKSDPGYIAREAVQAANTTWNIYMSLVNYVPAVVMAIVYGSYSDKFGRRLILILPIFGSLYGATLQMCVIYFDLPVWCFLFGVGEYLFGGFPVLITGAFAYIADVVPPEKRAFRMTILDAIILGTAAVGSVIVGYMINSLGFFFPNLFCVVGKLLTLAYAVFLIPESVDTENTGQRPNYCNQIKDGLKLYLVDNGKRRRIQLILLVLSYLVGDLIGSMSIITLFEMNEPLCWNSVLIGYFGAASEVIKCIAMTAAALYLKRILSEKWLAVLGLGFSITYYIYLAFIVSTTMMFFSPILGCFSYLRIPMTRALMSKLVKSDEQGSVFAVMTAMSTTASLVSSLTSNKVYAATLFVMEGFVFLLAAGVNCLALLIFLFYIYKSWKIEQSAAGSGSEVDPGTDVPEDD